MHELVWNTPMLVSGIILTVTFIGIFTEAVHGFHRTKFAMGGAGLMILAGQYFGFYNFTPEWGIGTAPIVSVNWDAQKGGDKLAFPVGAGVTRTFRLGKLPARLLLEGQYYAVQRDSFGPEWNFRVALGIFLPKLFGK